MEPLALYAQFPTFFSAGYVTHEGPAPEEMDKLTFTITLVGEGWGEKLLEPTDIHADPPKKTKVVKVRREEEKQFKTYLLFVYKLLL